MLTKKTKVLIDGNNNLYRAMFAQSDIYNSKLEYTGASFGFLRIIQNISHMGDIIVCFDGPNSSKYRRDIYPQYKMNRIKPENLMTPEDKQIQHKKNTSLKQIPELLKALGIPNVMINEVEADDIMFILAKYYLSIGHEVIIVSSDRDMQQLLHLGLKVYSYIKEEMLDEERFIENNGYSSKYIVIEKAICGDSSDNIKGIYKVGIKTFQKIMSEITDYSVNGILNWATNDKPSKSKQKILESKDLLELNCKIIDLEKSGLEFNKILQKCLKVFSYTNKNIENIIKLFSYYEFKTLSDMMYYNYYKGDN